MVVDTRDWLDIATAPGLRRDVEDALMDAPEVVTVDLHRCAGADAYGLGVLCDLQREAREHGAELQVVRVPRQIRRVLELLEVDSLGPVRTGSSGAR